MRFMGGKFRQSKQIAKIIGERHGKGFHYCEPFAGGMWSATRVIKELNPTQVLLSDINRPLVLLWQGLIDGSITLPTYCTQETHAKYKETQDPDDPLTAWYGIACSFGGMWYGTFARRERGDTIYDCTPDIKSTMKKIAILRQAHNLELNCQDYWDQTKDLQDWVIYLDPPYDNSMKVHGFSGSFDYPLFYDRARFLGQYNDVYITCFDAPENTVTLFEWGNTTTTVSSSKGQSGYRHKKKVNEKLIQLF